MTQIYIKIVYQSVFLSKAAVGKVTMLCKVGHQVSIFMLVPTFGQL